MLLRWTLHGDRLRQQQRGPWRESAARGYWIRRTLAGMARAGWVATEAPHLSWTDDQGDDFIRNRYRYVLEVQADRAGTSSL